MQNAKTTKKGWALREALQIALRNGKRGKKARRKRKILESY